MVESRVQRGRQADEQNSRGPGNNQHLLHVLTKLAVTSRDFTAPLSLRFRPFEFMSKSTKQGDIE